MEDFTSTRCFTLLAKWERGTRILHIGHHMAAASCENKGRVLGIGVVILTAIVTSGIFASTKESTDTTIRYICGFVGLLAVAISSISNFLKYPELAEKHRVAAATFGEIRNQIQVLIACEQKECHHCTDRCSETARIKEMLAVAESKHISLPQRFHDKAQAMVGKGIDGERK